MSELKPKAFETGETRVQTVSVTDAEKISRILKNTRHFKTVTESVNEFWKEVNEQEINLDNFLYHILAEFVTKKRRRSSLMDLFEEIFNC